MCARYSTSHGVVLVLLFTQLLAHRPQAHLHDLEEELKLPVTIKYVIYQDQNKSWCEIFVACVWYAPYVLSLYLTGVFKQSLKRAAGSPTDCLCLKVCPIVMTACSCWHN